MASRDTARRQAVKGAVLQKRKFRTRFSSELRNSHKKYPQYFRALIKTDFEGTDAKSQDSKFQMLERKNVFQICIVDTANVFHRFKYYSNTCIQEEKHVIIAKRRDENKYKKYSDKIK